ncbi:MAG: flagellar basal-body rod protein FlgG [Nitrospinota bacterium]
MIRALHTGATGMAAQQLSMDVIANNLANVNTVGFKKSRADFKDIFYQVIKGAGSVGEDGSRVPTGIHVGLGVKPSSITRESSQGALQNSQNELDLAIEGSGLFQIERSDGSLVYSRAGNFILNSEGNIVTVDGSKLYPSVTVPEDAQSISIDKLGIISVVRDGYETTEEIGQIELASFINEAGLLSIGDSFYAKTDASGDPITGSPRTDQFGEILQGFVETSNVEMVDELTSMILVQRAYEILSKVVQAGDDMLQVVNQLKR